MPDAINVTVDPYLIALPDPCNSVEDLENFIACLLEWSSTIEREEIDILISQSCLDALYEDGSYPYDHKLRSLFQQYTTDDQPIADEDTVCQLVMSLLQRTPYLEEKIDISEILHEEEKCQIEPADFFSRLNPQSAQALRDTLIMLGMWQQYSEESSTSGGCIFATAKDENFESHPELSVEAEVSFVLPFFESNPCCYSVPAAVNESFHICYGHGDILQQAGCFELWDAGNSESGAIDAIKLRIQELIDQGSAANQDVTPYSLGPEFLASARKWGFQRPDLAMNLIDSCARIAVGIPSKVVKPFRKSDNSPDQRERTTDKALAWRNHLTKGGPGFRLMYWKKTTGEIEFANVGPKHELIIHE
jgi:hypothetical protein